ncbi:ABC transporter permease [Halosolutus halophilus]|uniref:ABC transporter permease n=1 Tax=Halosolutus halophilus TaxID=1552990 RepID=UPI0022351D74|nr:ABC transporter permease [Halosolutus halophilus]
MSIHTVVRRWVGLVGVAVRRAVSRATHTAQQRVLFSVLGVAIAITLLVAVTGIGIGLATGTTVYDDDVDYWIVPESDGINSPLVATDGPQFGSVHETTDRINEIEDVTSATPVLIQVLRVEGGSSTEYVLVVGVVDHPDVDRVAGVSTTPLTPGDPYYADGGYDGQWTGEVVLSDSAAAVLEASAGDSVTVGGNGSFTVAGVDESAERIGDVPTAVVQLSELQSVTGADRHDQADQFIVATNSPAVEDELAGVYEQSAVLTRSELTATQTIDAELPVALGFAAIVVAVTIGTLFVVTTSGLELVADRQQLATMSALGVSVRSQLTFVSVQTLVTTALGGLLGGIGGLVTVRVVNELATRTITTEPIAASSPLFVPYGLVVGVVIGLLSVPWLLVATRRLTGGVP